MSTSRPVIAAVRKRTALSTVGVLLWALAGCSDSDSARQDLLQATTDTIAAVRSGELTLDLLDRGRTTQGQAETTFVEMTDEVQSAEKAVGDIRIADPAQFAERDAVLAAVRAGSSAVLTGRDCVATKSSCRLASEQLTAADQQLTAIEQRLTGG